MEQIQTFFAAYSPIIMLIVMYLAFHFFLIRPQKAEKARREEALRSGNKAGQWEEIGAGGRKRFHVLRPRGLKRFPYPIRAKPKRFAHLAHKEALLSGATIPNGPEPTWLFLAELQNEALPLARTQEVPGWPLKNRQR